MTTADTTESRPLTKLTVNLLPAAIEALNEAADLCGDSRTDTVNRALQVYARLVAEQNDGSTIQLRRPFPGLLGKLGFGRVQTFVILNTATTEEDR